MGFVMKVDAARSVSPVTCSGHVPQICVPVVLYEKEIILHTETDESILAK